uniref:restriction endonuclease subunit S n=1 Tax=Bacteroides fragilis TaxID=817 RepID=UPI0004B0DCB2|nr:restriction endonuclease subunit S [Bacteroides fragilis]
MANNNENKVLNVPNLRFPEFTGEWEKKKMKDVCTFYSGGTPTSSNKDYYSGDIPFIRSGELHERSTELFISEDGLNNSSAKMVYKGDLLLALYGATSGDIAISQIEGAINQAILCINTQHSKEYIKSIWQKHVQKILQTYLQGGQGNLSADIVKNLSFYFASSKEQGKLANFIRLLDERITTQNKIIEDLKKLKSAIIHRCYSSKTNMISLSELLKQCSERNHSGWDLQVLSVSNRYGFIAQSDQFEDREVASDDTSNYKIVEKGMFAYNPARINVGSIALYEMDGKGIVSPMYVCFTTKHTLLPGYLKHYFASQAFRHEMYKRLEGSVRLCLTFEGLCNIEIPLPSIEIQENVGKYLSTIEHKVSLEKSVLSQYQLQRSYLLSQMFI